MRHTLRMLTAALVAAAAITGCVETDDGDESRTGDDANEATLTVNVPTGTDELLVEVIAWDQSANETTTVHAQVENDARNETLAEDSFGVVNETRHEMTVGVAGHERVHVTARVVEGAADVEIAVWAIVEGEAPTVIVRERVIVHEREVEGEAPMPATADPTPEPATPTEAAPTPTPTSPTPDAGDGDGDANETADNETAGEPATNQTEG